VKQALYNARVVAGDTVGQRFDACVAQAIAAQAKGLEEASFIIVIIKSCS
jgi:hypothetical protein